ncbi:MAG: trypsin-like peptidase domain-containing protein, partial [Planctomycetes bacterium]|nr:trypsin-like peptidase domain-containing protein [Planctomycetota bacterium]
MPSIWIRRCAACLLVCTVAMAAPSGESLVAGLDDLADFRQVIAAAKSRVFPSVVFLMPIAERYDAGRREKAQVAGSGVIISASGEIVTNWHVVDKAVEIRCLLYDGTACRATIVGVDRDTDLALLRVEGTPDTVFPAAELADSRQLEEGQFVMAMGAPWGLSRSVSMGILSCVDRFLPGQGGGYNLWLQTDASINPGNSGGPLIDTDGRVVGINSLGSLLGGDLAFAIPAGT